MADFRNPGNVTSGARRKLHCPQCGSDRINITTESSVSGGVTTHSGYGSVTRFDNDHRNYWICNDCGAKFRNIQNLEEEIKKVKKSSVTCIIWSIITFIFSCVLVGMIVAKPWLALVVGAITFGTVLTAIVFFVFIFVYRGRVKKMEQEKAYLLENCFNW